MSWFRLYRENVEDPQNSMMSEIFQLILQSRQEQQGATTSTDTERKRVMLLTTESYLIFISDGCFVIGKQRYLNLGWKWYAGREPDGKVCKCMFDFEYRSNTLVDRSLRGNNAILKGYPTIIAYQPEYPSSSITLNGTSSYVDMGNTANLNVGVTADSEVTYSCWIYYTANPSASAYVMSRGNAPGLLIYVSTTGEIRCDFRYQDATSFFAGSGINTKSFWHHVLVRHSDKTNLSTLFVDGVKKAEQTKNTFLTNSGTGVEDRFMLGAHPTGASTQTNFFPGKIDGCKVYSRAVTDAEALLLSQGVEISTVGLVSEWNFDEDFHITKAPDSHGFNTGTMVNCTYDKTIKPAQLPTPFPYEDEMINKCIGYKTNGEYLVIPELEDDFRITGKTTGGLWYRWEVKLTTFAVQNVNQMRLLEKPDDATLNYFQSYQIGSDGKFYCFGIFNGVQKKVRTVLPLSLLKKYDIIAGIVFSAVAGGVATSIFQVYIDGFLAAIETTTVDPNFPAATDIKTFDTRILTGVEVERGFLVGQIYSFRYYEEAITAANALGVQTNRFTTYNIDRGHVLKSNMTRLPLTQVFRSIEFEIEPTKISDVMTAIVTDLVQTGRFTSPASLIPISDDFDAFVSPIGPMLGNYAIDITNTTGTHSWVEIPTIDPVKDHFSVFAWVKYRGKVGDWAGIISGIDGLDNGNRLLIDPTHIRYQGQFDKESNDWEDFRVTVPSLTGAYHLIGFTHDGDAKEFRIYLDGKRQKTFKAKGDIRGTDKSKTFIGKGAKNGFYFDGLIDDLFIWRRTLTQKDINKLMLKIPVEKGTMAHFNWEKTFKDVEDGKFNGKKVGTIKFSTDHV
jgi:hypothetical protein